MLERKEKDKRHLHNVALLDKSFWHDKWWEKGIPRPRLPVKEIIFPQKIDKKPAQDHPK
jgi:hypothetical protein